MWQVLLAAAVAGSGFFAKRLIIPTNAAEPSSISEQTNPKCDHSENSQHCSDDSSQPQVSTILPCDRDQNIENLTQSCISGDGSIFRFSSASGIKGPTGSRMGWKSLRKKPGRESRGIRGNVEGSGGTVEKKCRSVNGSLGFVVDQRKSGKKFVCLKKRRTGRNACANCESCTSKDNSFFGWGLGVGMIYMLSAGKAEVDRLKMVMDGTTKVVQELKSELSERKLLCSRHASSFKTEVNTNPIKISGGHIQAVLTKSSFENRDHFLVSGLPETNEGECESSTLTEEPQPEMLEMDQLEAELESELQKLPWCTLKSSGIEGKISDACKTEVSAKEFHEPNAPNSSSSQVSSVLPYELNQKLCHLLIEQQESQIVGLESALHRTNSKLQDKEAELQALKECVKRLTHFSLGSASDEEAEAEVEEEIASEGGHEKKRGCAMDSNRSTVGMKRAMDFESYGQQLSGF